ncbi:MAG: hypothetical protein QMD04_12035 [Anaerolineales bacterium]|nr:hypothetical protein [Anaerolineales bacterium]
MKNDFKRNWVGWVLVILNLLAALNSTYFFLGQLGVGAVGWLMMNTCAPSVFLFVLGFLVSSPLLMAAAGVLMFRYGTLGMFVFAWDGYNIIPQIGHILMTLAVLYILVDVIRNRRWRALGWGLALGLAILIPLVFAQNAWFAAKPGVMEKLFSGSLYPQRP